MNVAVWKLYYGSSGRLWLVVNGADDYDEQTVDLEELSVGFAAGYRYDGSEVGFFSLS